MDTSKGQGGALPQSEVPSPQGGGAPEITHEMVAAGRKAAAAYFDYPAQVPELMIREILAAALGTLRPSR